MVSLPVLIPLSEAARKYGLEERDLRDMVEKGKIRAGVTMDKMIVVNEEDVLHQAMESQGLSKEDLPEYKMYAHLKGIPIWIREASRRYKVSPDTLSEWCRKGYIRKLGTDGNKVLIDEADVAYCASIYAKVARQGRRVFNPDGTPYRPKTSSLVG